MSQKLANAVATKRLKMYTHKNVYTSFCIYIILTPLKSLVA